MSAEELLADRFAFSQNTLHVKNLHSLRGLNVKQLNELANVAIPRFASKYRKSFGAVEKWPSAADSQGQERGLVTGFQKEEETNRISVDRKSRAAQRKAANGKQVLGNVAISRQIALLCDNVVLGKLECAEVCSERRKTVSFQSQIPGSRNGHAGRRSL